MILFNPTSSYLFLSSQGTEVNKNSTSYTSVVSPQKKKKKKKEKKNKERVWDQTKLHDVRQIRNLTSFCTNLSFRHKTLFKMFAY